MIASRPAAIATALFLAASSTEASADAPATWKLAEWCSPAGAPPGKGFFEVRVKTDGVETEAIDIRGCAGNRSFHKTLKWRGDFVNVKVYAVPFFRKDRFDILLEMGWDDSVDYLLLTAASDYDKSAFEFSAVDAPYFGDSNGDGRWEIRIQNLETLKCGNGAKWGQEFVGLGRADFDADSLCKPRADDEHL